MLITSNNNKKMIKKVAVIIVTLVFVMILFNQRAYAVKKSLTLNENKIEISKGETYILIASAVGLKKKVTWSSSNKKVATVKRGVIVGKRKGKTTIIAKCGRMKAKCKVVVKAETETGIYHTEKGDIRYEDYRTPNSNYNLTIDISGDKLIIEGKMKRSILGEYGKPEIVKGDRHIFILSSATKFWSGDIEISKERFLSIEKVDRKKWANQDTISFMLDMKDGKVVNAGWV